MTALYVLGALLLVLLAAAVLSPLVEPEPPEGEIHDLPPRQRREAALEALRELRFEYESGKLPEEEYRELKARYGRIALDARHELEGGEGSGAVRGGHRCRECGREVSPEARYCPGCGVPRATAGEEGASAAEGGTPAAGELRGPGASPPTGEADPARKGGDSGDG